jgi:hypothetical protein
MREAPAPGRHREEREARRGDPEGDGRRPVIPGLLRFARNDGGSETLAISPKRSAERIRTLLAQNGVGLEDRRRADSGAEVDRARRGGVAFVIKRLIDLDGWAVADNLASVGRAASSRPRAARRGRGLDRKSTPARIARLTALERGRQIGRERGGA